MTRNTRVEQRIFLVHGTFAENASWIQEGSKIASVLNKKLNAKVIPFSWNGGNSHKDRTEAARNLRDAIKQDVAENSNSIHSIIAHSHGGNVAIRALAGLNPQPTVNWLVCLGTPFLVCGQPYSGRLGKVLSWVIWALVFALMCVPLFYSSIFLGISLVVDDFGYWSIAAAATLFILLLFLAFLLPKLVVGWVTGFISRRHHHLAHDLRWPTETNTRMLNYQIAFDEARLIVSLFSRLSGLPRRVWDLGAAVIAKLYWPFLLLISLAAVVSLALDLPDDHWIGLVAIPMVLLFYIGFLLIPLILLALLSPLLRSHPAGFGWEGITQHFVYDVDIVKSPEGYWRGEFENAILELDKRLGKVGHSSFYDEDEVIDEIVARLRSK